ncbi:dynein axonemal heavy chain 3-like [Erpetoichthys calabaricus]|uniref:dynein axonemal heavy chain 3-like n=1 Tax=Erpetoichthys calabaricus TaxID=27687 RepID=UPI0022349471|nr:dynein axonemal heavy chain 3-like [Erpetoichthys calabaricus]
MRSSSLKTSSVGAGSSSEASTHLNIPTPAGNRAFSKGSIVKLSNHILLLTYQNEVLKHMLEETRLSSSPESPGFLNIPLSYTYDENTRDISIHVRTYTEADGFLHKYGFEYQGSAERGLITPLTERTLYNLLSVFSRGTGILLTGPERTGKQTTLKEISLLLGKALFFISCSKAVDHKTLIDVCHGLAAAGDLVCFLDIDRMKPLALYDVAYWMGQIQEAVHAGKASVLMESQDVPLKLNGGCVATITSYPVKQIRNGQLPRFASPVATIPDCLLQCFRVVSSTDVSHSFIVETLLFVAGFSGVGLQARKLLALFDFFLKTSATFTASSVHLGNGIDTDPSTDFPPQ